jgi:hypothetical protein
MKRALLVATIASILFCPPAFAQNQDGFGLGIMVGEPTGVNGKVWLSGKSALDMGAAWSFDNDSNFQAQLDYVVHSFSLISVKKGQLPLYYGIGGRFKARETGDDSFGVRVPVGLDYLFENSHFDVFFEVVPTLDLAPSTDFDLNAALGGRFFF